MQEILDLAERLGKAIAAHSRAAALAEMRKKLQADPQASQLLKDFQEQARKIAQLEAGQKPVEVEDKHRLSDLQERIASNELLKKWMRLQADYSELWNKVNRAMLTPILQSRGPEEAQHAPQAPQPQ